MRIERAVLRRVEMPLRFRFRTSFGETTIKKLLLLELRSHEHSGWGECVAEEGPFYSPETLVTADHVLRDFLLPLVVGRERTSAAEFERLAARVRGHRMAKACVETALRDLEARAEGVSLAARIGGTRSSVEVGVSLGLSPTPGETVENVRKHVAQGYRRIKLKIEPGSDVDRLEAVRDAFPDIVLTVDANAAYRLSEHLAHLVSLDRFGLDYIEQPLHHEDFKAHAELATAMRTPICLDESIRSAADVELAHAISACRVVNVKIGRVGGYGEVLRIHEAALRLGIPLWCGGMLEAGVGRAHNIAIASLAGFTKPGDTSSASRYFDEDLVDPPLEASAGLMPVPPGPGIGVHVRPEVLSRHTTAVVEVLP